MDPVEDPAAVGSARRCQTAKQLYLILPITRSSVVMTYRGIDRQEDCGCRKCLRATSPSIGAKLLQIDQPEAEAMSMNLTLPVNIPAHY